MDSKQYIENAMKTSSKVPTIDSLVDVGLGLAGEAGEVADLIKKWHSQGHELNEQKIKEELGDLFWYQAKACKIFGWTFEEIMQENIDKLKKRYGEKFSAEKSINRSE